MPANAFEMYRVFALGASAGGLTLEPRSGSRHVEAPGERTQAEEGGPARRTRLASPYRRFDEDHRNTDVTAIELHRFLEKHLAGGLDAGILRSWTLAALARVESLPANADLSTREDERRARNCRAAARASFAPRRASPRLLGLVATLLDDRFETAARRRAAECLRWISSRLEIESGLDLEHGPRAVTGSQFARGACERVLQLSSPRRDEVLDHFLGGLSTLHLETLESGSSMLEHRRERGQREPGGGQWRDFALRPQSPASRRETLTLVPLSVFTRSFFHGVLPRLVAERPEDRFRFRADRDRAPALLARHAQLRAAPWSFQLFIDRHGVAEVVLDTHEIRTRERIFAARVLAMFHGASRVVLDGVVVQGSASTAAAKEIAPTEERDVDRLPASPRVARRRPAPQELP